MIRELLTGTREFVVAVLADPPPPKHLRRPVSAHLAFYGSRPAVGKTRRRCCPNCGRRMP